MNYNSSLEDYFSKIKTVLAEAQSEEILFNSIVNAPFHNKLHTTSMDLGIVVLLTVDNKSKSIHRVALSDTEPARWAVKMTPVPFHDIKIPLDDKDNIIAKAVRTGKPQNTADWKYLFVPALSPEASRFNQAGAGIACSFVYPLKDGARGGAMIFSFYQPISNITPKHLGFMDKYSVITSEALRNRK